MRIQPVKSYRTPRYPRAAEAKANPELLEASPARRGKGGPWGGLLGAGLALQLLFCAEASGEEAGTAPATQQEGGQQPEPTPAETQPQKNGNDCGMFDVAPILEEALEHDGRGAFGCEAITPAAFFSEEEAVDVIRKELAAAGIKLKTGTLTLHGIATPCTTTMGWENSNEKQGKCSPPAAFEFDGASEDGTIVFEYISQKDFTAWDVGHTYIDKDGNEVHVYCSASSYNFVKAAQTFANSLAGTAAGANRTVGVFFDPLARPDRKKVEELLKEKKADLAGKDYRFLAEEDAKSNATEKVKAQVAAFVAYLKQQGKLPKTATTPEAAKPQDNAPAEPQPAKTEPNEKTAAGTAPSADADKRKKDEADKTVTVF